MSENVQDQGQHESLLAALVGEDKKYATIEELAKSRLAADQHIETLEAEMAELRKSAQEQNTIKDVMDALKASKKESSTEGETPLDDDVLQQKITSLLEERDAERTRKANRSEAEKLVQSKTDRPPADFVKEKAVEMGLSEEALWNLSEESPTGFANLVGLGNRQPQSSGSPGALPHANTDALGANASVTEIEGHKTKRWYDEKRKEIGAKKFINDRSIQLGMLRSREALGDKFYT